jgi:peptidoglycan-associated lipoprotein
MKMRNGLGSRTIAALGIALLAAGCATKGQLRTGLAEQQAALEAERAERLAADQRIGTEVERVAANLEEFRTDLAAMSTEFGTKLTLLEEGMQLAVPVHFGFDQADVDGEANPVLDRFAQIVQRTYPQATITVEGFADPAGPAAYNKRLAQNRAEAVRAELIERGLPETQLRAIGYGEERQVVPGAAGSAFGAELNRRVVFVIETPPNADAGIPATSTMR